MRGKKHLEAQFLSTCEPVKPVGYMLPKYSGGTGIGGTLPFLKGEMKKKGGVLGKSKT